MPAKIGSDAHKQFSVFVTIDGKGKTSPAVRVEHHRQQYIDFPRSLPQGSEIALEATGHWYWMVDEMEKAGHRPHLANPSEAKKRMGGATRPMESGQTPPAPTATPPEPTPPTAYRPHAHVPPARRTPPR